MESLDLAIVSILSQFVEDINRNCQQLANVRTMVLEAVVRRCSVKKVFLEISENSQENTCVRVSFLIKLQAAPATLLKKRLWHRCFPVNFAKFPRTPFLKEHLWWLLLWFVKSVS